jgi:hypothetical protein
MSQLRIHLHVGAMFVALGMTACAAAPRERPIELGPVDTGPGTLTAARKYLEGRWSLVSYEVFPPGASPIQLKGSGTLTYDEYGNLETLIRVDDATAKTLETAGISTTNGGFSASGRTVVDMRARTLTYVLEGQPPLGAPSGPLALNRPRHWEVEGNLLTLTTRGEDGQPLSVGKWQKTP